MGFFRVIVNIGQNYVVQPSVRGSGRKTFLHILEKNSSLFSSMMMIIFPFQNVFFSSLQLFATQWGNLRSVRPSCKSNKVSSKHHCEDYRLLSSHIVV